MGSTIPEEVIKEFVEEQVEEMISEVEQAVQEYQKQQIAAKLEELTQDVLSELESRNVDTDRANTHAIAQENLLEAMSGTEQSEGRTVEIPVAGRNNEGVSTELTLKEPDPPTKTIEVPIEGGDVENPDTVEREVIDPEISTDGLSPEKKAEIRRNQPENEKESESDDVPEGGFPWYQ